MKLELTQKFSLEVSGEEYEDSTITGYIKPITKKQQKELKQSFKEEQKEAKVLQRKSILLQRFAIEVSKAESNNDESIKTLYKTLDKMTLDVENLTEKIQENNVKEKMAESLFNARVNSDNIEKLKEICDIVGYDKVLETIQKDIDEGKSKNSANS